jgi:hypothetical protein
LAIHELHHLRVLPSFIPDQRAVTNIYRPFFLAGILSVLTAGCTLGAIALLGIALQGSYTASTWTPYVLAHANSQLYGWVGFFIIGFALQQHAPRMSRVRLFHTLAWISLASMALGIAIRFIAEPLVHTDPSTWVPVGIASAMLQLLAFLVFVANIGLTRYKSGEGPNWQAIFVFASLAWWGIIAMVEPYFFAMSHHQDPRQSILFVAEYFAPYREAQFLGFVTMMIFGVSLVKMHTCFGAEKACPYFGKAGFALWTVGIMMRMVGWLIYFRSGMVHGGLYFGGGWVLAAGALCLVISSRMFRPLSMHLSSHKFIRAAYAWLLVAGLLICFESAHLSLIGQPFSHAYTGAIRHAVTVGFISQMILGVGLRVVRQMNDLPTETTPNLYAAFVLLNVGNALRVSLEISTDYSSLAFIPMGVTGFIELVALALWASAMFRSMLHGKKFSSLKRKILKRLIRGANELTPDVS